MEIWNSTIRKCKLCVDTTYDSPLSTEWKNRFSTCASNFASVSSSGTVVINRVFCDKEGGLVVDYVGIATALKQAMNDYTSRDKNNYGDTDVAKVAYPKFLEKLSVCRDKFHGYDYTKFINGTDLERAKTISGAVNFILSREKVDDKDSFVKEALMLHQALSLCSSLVDEDSRFEAAFFEAVRVLVLRLINTGVGKKISLPEMNARINELLKQSIKSDGVINLFSDIKEEFSLFDPKFLQEVANRPSCIQWKKL